MLIRGDITFGRFINYCIAQITGAFAGSALLYAIFSLAGIADKTNGMGSNGTSGVGDNMTAALIVEIVLTFIFVIAVLGVTSAKAGHGSFGGLVIGFSLMLVHIIGIGLTGTSVNPARSLGPALMALITGNGAPISVIWIFIAGPLAGGALAALCYKALEKQ